MNEADKQVTHRTRNVKRFKDESGNTYGRLTVLSFAGQNRLRAATFLCRCECGNETTVAGSSLRTGNTKSCGFCNSGDHVARKRQRHGLTETPEYEAWQAMKNRCYRQKDEHFYRYGGRGITVCDRWRNDFAVFYDDVGRRPSPKYSLNRIDNDKNYEPSNVEWCPSKSEQCNNRSTNRFLECFGKRQTLTQWAREVGLNVPTISLRIKSGWSVERALTSPIQKLKRKASA